MSRVAINTGAIANDGTGDTLRSAGGIINSNFLELYSYLGSGSTTTLAVPIWGKTNAGINTLRNVGIGTTNPRFTLEVGAVGASGTTLHVNGDARITGIVTIGTSSITLNGSTNRITVGSGVTIDGSTGIISATSIRLGGTTITGAGVTYITAGSGISVNQNTGNVTITATGGGGGGESYWASTTAGIHTTSNVGVGTTNPTSALTVKGNTSLETLNVTGVSTFNSTLNGVYLNNAANVRDTSNIAIGQDALLNHTNGDNSIAIGYRALYTASNINFSNIGIGYQAGYLVSNGVLNTFLGYKSGYDMLGGSGNVIIGSFDGNAYGLDIRNADDYIILSANGQTSTQPRLVIDPNGNTGIGTTNPTSTLTVGAVGAAITTLTVNGYAKINGINIQSPGSENIYIGDSAGLLRGSADSSNVALGYYAARNSDGMDRNVVVGAYAGEHVQSNWNTILGYEAGKSNSGAPLTGAHNTLIGHQAGLLMQGSSYQNTFVGSGAGDAVTSGDNNTILGRYTGNENGLDIRTSSNNVVLSDGAGNIRLYTNSSGNTGIGTTNPTSKLYVLGDTRVVGTVTATSFVGDGSGLTGITAVGSGVAVQDDGSSVGTAATINFGTGLNVSFGSGIATVTGITTANINASTLNVSGVATATDSELYTNFIVTNGGASSYQFASTGIGFTQTTDNPTLYLTRGKNYQFSVNASGHPFYIKTTQSTGTGNQYNDGVTNNGVEVGNITFKVPYNAPSLIYYICQFHSAMSGKIYVVDAGIGPDVNVNTTGIITATSFVGSGLNLTGVTTNFTASGSGAVTRTFNTKLRELISVKDYGATGDGSTDDTTYIQNAINSISSTGGSIYFPQGTYKITSPLTVSNNTSIFGTGQTSKIQPGVGVTAILTYSATSNVTVEKLHFDGINTTNLTALYFPGGINNQFVHVSDCLFASMNTAIEMATDSYVVANNYAIDANTFFYGSDSSLNGSIHSNYILGGQYSVYLKQSGSNQAEGVRIFDNTFLNTSSNALSVFIEAGLEIEIFDNIIDQVGSYGYSVYCSPAAGKAISSVKVLNNWCDSGNVGGSVYFYNCNQIIVDSNTFSSSSGIGTALTIKSGNQYSSTKNICLNAFSNVVDYSGSVNQYQTGNVYSPSVGTATSFERNIYENDLAVGLSTARGVILTSPNGTKYRLHVLNDGTLRTISVT